MNRRGIVRVQMKIKRSCRYLFYAVPVYPNTIFIVDSMTEKISSRHDQIFDFLPRSKTVQVGNSLYTISNVDWQLSVIRYSGLNKWLDVVKTPLASIKKDRVAFVVTNYRARVLYVTGGCDFDTVQGSVFLFNLNDNKWSEGHPLAQPRYSHSSCVLSDRLYVFGGRVLSKQPLSSIEILDIQKAEWNIVDIEGL